MNAKNTKEIKEFIAYACAVTITIIIALLI